MRYILGTTFAGTASATTLVLGINWLLSIKLLNISISQIKSNITKTSYSKWSKFVANFINKKLIIDILPL